MQQPEDMTDEVEKRVSLIQMAKGSVESSFNDYTEPDADIMPELVWRSKDNQLGVMVFAIPLDSDEDKALHADMMTCHLIMQQALEVSYCITILAVTGGNFAEWEAAGRPNLENFPGRTESVLLLHYTRDGETTWRADIIRYPEKPPTLGEWQDMGGGVLSGRFSSALLMGLKLGAKIPDGMAESYRRRMDEQGGEEVMGEVIRGLRTARMLAKAEAKK